MNKEKTKWQVVYRPREPGWISTTAWYYSKDMAEDVKKSLDEESPEYEHKVVEKK